MAVWEDRSHEACVELKLSPFFKFWIDFCQLRMWRCDLERHKTESLLERHTDVLRHKRKISYHGHQRNCLMHAGPGSPAATWRPSATNESASRRSWQTDSSSLNSKESKHFRRRVSPLIGQTTQFLTQGLLVAAISSY